jgi:hypothetical protein
VLKLSPADDQDPVEAFAADDANPALGECVRLRRPERRANDLDALASEDVIEGLLGSNSVWAQLANISRCGASARRNLPIRLGSSPARRSVDRIRQCRCGSQDHAIGDRDDGESSAGS